MRRISRAFQQNSETVLREFGVSGPQLWLLKILHVENGISVSELSRKMFLHISTVSSIISRLEAKGYLLRKKPKTDRRVVTVHLAPKGEKLSFSVPEHVQGRFFPGIQELSLTEILNCLHALQHIVGLME